MDKGSDRSKTDLVENAIDIIEGKIKAGELKPTVAEYVRLLELRNEMDADEPREIKVTWVEPGETTSSTEK